MPVPLPSRPTSAHNSDLRRRHRRVSLLWAGQLKGPDRGSAKQPASCAILNLSSGGARLRVSDGGDYPTRVELESARFGRMPARVVWRKGNELGLTFLAAPTKVAGALAGLLSPASPAAAGA